MPFLCLLFGPVWGFLAFYFLLEISILSSIYILVYYRLLLELYYGIKFSLDKVYKNH